MAKNQVQYQKRYSLIELFNDYGTEAQCITALFSWKWPQGFQCTKFSSTRCCTLKCLKFYQCNHCHHQTSLTRETIFACTKLALTRWLIAIHLITQAKTGISSLALKREIGVSYNTAWSMKQNIIQVMKERDDSQPLSGIVQTDDAYYGGELHGGKRGRGSENKIPSIAAVSTNEKGHPIRMNFTVQKGFRLTEISQWSKKYLSSGSIIVSDTLACFKAVEDMLPRFAYIALRTPPSYAEQILEYG